MKEKYNSPKLVIEATLSILRWALIFAIINNAIWYAGTRDTKQSPSNNTEIHVTQDGTGNSNTQNIKSPGATLNQ